MGIQAESTGILDIIRGMGGFIDENGMLQLGKGFCVGESIPPHGKIFQDFAECVQEAYGETGLREVSEAEARMIHQFRMYIDRHNIAYIRKFFKRNGMTDEEALMTYVQTDIGRG